MSTWLVFMQIVVNVGLLLGLFLVWAKTSKPQKEDARLSKGLQLLQSKISILEDLSDRTDVQVRQLSALLASKVVEVQQKINESDRQIIAIEKSMEKSLEVSKIFQDKIPHREIIERENSFKYIEAARMAHRGVGADEISRQLGIPLSEASIVVSMNKERLNVNENDIPPWAKPHLAPEPKVQTGTSQEYPISPLQGFGAMEQAIPNQPFVDITQQQSSAQPLPPTPLAASQASTQPEPMHVLTTAKNKPLNITPYEFPKINQADKKYI